MEVDFMKKRTNTAFWVEKESRWCIAVQKNGTRKRFYSSTPGRTGQREANAKADAWLDDSIRDGRKKVATLYAEWVEELKLTCGTSYVIQCNKYGEYYILPVCGNIRIDELTEGDLQKAIDMSFKKRCLKKGGKRTSDKPLSRKTLMTIRSTEISFVKWCRRNKYSALFPELSIPKNARMGKKNILQPSALKILFDVDSRLYYGKRVFDEYIYAYRFAVATGVRPGELVGLWYGDIKGNTVNLRRSINRMDEETTGKNENAIRSFDMGKEAREAYEAQTALLKASGIPLNYTTSLFQIQNQRALFKRWKKYQRDNGIEPQVTLYEMRHTFVSIESGVLTDSQLKMLVGHSKNMDTAGVYRHELDGQREDLAAATTAAFKKAQA
jgi:integrase